MHQKSNLFKLEDLVKGLKLKKIPDPSRKILLAIKEIDKVKARLSICYHHDPKTYQFGNRKKITYGIKRLDHMREQLMRLYISTKTKKV